MFYDFQKGLKYKIGTKGNKDWPTNIFNSINVGKNRYVSKEWFGRKNPYSLKLKLEKEHKKFSQSFLMHIIRPSVSE